MLRSVGRDLTSLAFHSLLRLLCKQKAILIMVFAEAVSVKMVCVIDLSNSAFIHTCQNNIEIQDTLSFNSRQPLSKDALEAWYMNQNQLFVNIYLEV